MTEKKTPARLAADGKTVLEIGARVESTRDGLHGTVAAHDKSDRYVKVKFDVDGKVRARSTATLKPLPTRKPRTRKTAS